MPRKSIKTSMRITTIDSNRGNLTTEINKIIASECDGTGTISINLPHRIFNIIEERAGWGGRSRFIKQKVYDFIDRYKKRWKDDCPVYPSRCELIRHALMDFFLHEDDIIVIPKEKEKEHPADRYIRENGLRIIGKA